jgi:hypothetical protein
LSDDVARQKAAHPSVLGLPSPNYGLDIRLTVGAPSRQKIPRTCRGWENEGPLS